MEIKDSQGEQRYGAMGTAFAVLVGVLILQKSNIGSPSIYPLDAGPFLVQTVTKYQLFLSTSITHLPLNRAMITASIK